jgi:hypothetical protein
VVNPIPDRPMETREGRGRGGADLAWCRLEERARLGACLVMEMGLLGRRREKKNTAWAADLLLGTRTGTGMGTGIGPPGNSCRDTVWQTTGDL